MIDKEECDMDADELMMLALDAGAEDFSRRRRHAMKFLLRS